MKPAPGQLSLFSSHRTGREELSKLNSSVEPADVPRLTKQHAAILAALQQGPKTGPQLAVIAIRYSARLEELGRAGHRWEKQFIKPGVYQYTLL